MSKVYHVVEFYGIGSATIGSELMNTASVRQNFIITVLGQEQGYTVKYSPSPEGTLWSKRLIQTEYNF